MMQLLRPLVSRPQALEKTWHPASLLIFISLSLLNQGCTSMKSYTTEANSSQQAQPSLYQALGGQRGLIAIVDGLLSRIATDERIVQHFKEVDINLFRERLIEYLCLVTDGGCVYRGDSMGASHQGLNITQAHFDALVGHLIESMKDQALPLETRNALLKRLAPKYSEISYR
jgi:hemoglobin